IALRCRTWQAVARTACFVDDAHHSGMGTALHEVGHPVRASALDWAPALTVAVFIVPIGAGLVGTIAPAFGYLPAIGGNELTLAPWKALFAYPGFLSSLTVTLFTAVLATLGSIAIALGSCAFLHGSRLQRRLGALIAPLLAMPHAALAIGFAFVILPSGWI